MEYYGIPSTPTDDFLAHYGVKGMRWGIRRMQKPDGSLTKHGQKRVAQAGTMLEINYRGKGGRLNTANRQNVISENHKYRDEHHDEMYDRPGAPSRASKKYYERMKERYASATLKDLGLKDSKKARGSVKEVYRQIDPYYRSNYYPDTKKIAEYNKRRKEILHPVRTEIYKKVRKLIRK